MATGTITLNFESPDTNLTGLGEFDVSNTFKELFFNNPILKDEIKNKISEIFDNIKSKDIAKDLTDKIKKSFQIDPDKLNFTDVFGNKVKELLKGLNLDPDLINPTVNPEQIERATPEFIKQPVENITQKANKDTVFDIVQKVNITDFTDQALDKLSMVFGTTKDKNKKGKSIIGDNEIDTIESPKKGFLSGILNKLLAGLGLSALPSFLKGLAGPSLIAAGLVWMAVDGVKGWMMAGQWGTSKISAALGSILGGLGHGMEGAFKNMGKWALIGAGIGMRVNPILGTLIGGLIGAAVGAIMGWIGGENLAKTFDTINAWFTSTALPVIKKFGIKLKELWDDMSESFSTIIEKTGPILSDIWKEISNGIIKFGEILQDVYEAIKPAIKWAMEELIPAIMKFVGGMIPVIKTIVLDIWKYLEKSLVPILKSLWEAIKNIVGFLSPVVIWLIKNGDWIIGGLWDIFKKLFNVIDTVIIKPILRIIHLLIGAVNVFFDFGRWLGEAIFKITEWFGQFKKNFIAFGAAIGEGASLIVDWVKEKWNSTLTSFKDGFTKLFSWVGDFGKMIKDKITGFIPNWLKEKLGMSDDEATKIQQSKSNVSTTPVVKAQDIVVQPSSKDQFESIGSGGIFAKPDGLLDKKLDTLIKVMNEIQLILTNTLGVSKNIAKTDVTLLTEISEKLGILPSLVPQPAQNTTQVANADVRDPAFEYRINLYKDVWRGV
jgi:gas vesicle protein